MIEFKIDTKLADDRVGAMLGKINHFKRVDIGMEMSAWQTEDLHRHRPFTMRSRAKGRAATVIRPHSLYEVQRSAKTRGRVIRRFVKKTGLQLAVARQYLKYSSRPILRSDMNSRLQARMKRLLAEKITWGK